MCIKRWLKVNYNVYIIVQLVTFLKQKFQLIYDLFIQYGHLHVHIGVGSCYYIVTVFTKIT